MGFFSDLKEDLSQAVTETEAENETAEVAAEGEAKKEDIDLDALLNIVDEEVKKESAPAKPSFEPKKMDVFMASDETAIITKGMTITGDISSAGNLELLGTINGNIVVSGKLNVTGTIEGDSKAAEVYAENAKITGEVNSTGSIKIGQSSVIIGNIYATSAVIAGAVKGDIDVKGPVILDTSAIVMGNIKSKSVQINNGAVIEGVCSQCYADVSPSSFFEEFKKNKK